MKRFFALIALLLCLCACSAQPEQPVTPAETAADAAQPLQEPPEPPQDTSFLPEIPTVSPKPAYLFEGSDQNRIIADDGTVILESDQTLYLLQEEQSGTVAGLVECMQEGLVYDDYGWATPEQVQCVLYDLQGQPQMTLPWYHISLYGDWIYGSLVQTGGSEIRRLSDGAVLFTDVHVIFPTGGLLVFRPDHENNPQTILFPDGSTMQMPPLYRINGTCTDTDGSIYLVVQKSQLVGLMNLQGDLLVECQYKSVPMVRDGVAYCANTFSTDCIRLSDGQLLQTWPVQATAVYATCAVALQGNNQEQQVLVNLDGQLLYEQSFSYILAHDPEQDNQPELFQGVQYHQEGQFTTTHSVLLLPDGTVFRDDLSGTWEFHVLTPRIAVQNQRIRNEQTTTSTASLLDLQSSKVLAHWEAESMTVRPLYYMGYGDMDFVSQSCFLLSQQNPLGWSRSSLIAPDGTVLLEQLSDVHYRGGGVLQVRQGFTEGLLRTDGTWLYRQSRFSTIEE